MSDNLYVNMFGSFYLKYKGQIITLERNTLTKGMQLLQILLYCGEEGIARGQLLRYLYEREDIDDPTNNLNVTAHRIRKKLLAAGLPAWDYIKIENGNYYWDSPMNVILDVREFERLLERGRLCENEEEKLELYSKACRIYQGDFLVELHGENWVLMEALNYQNKYSETLQYVCDVLMEKGEYETVLELCEDAIKMYPFEEWQAVKIECLTSMNLYKEALAEYEATSKMFFEELGVAPSERVLEQFKHMNSKINNCEQGIEDIKKGLCEEEEDSGAYYLNYPNFVEVFRIIKRMSERNGQTACLMIVNIRDAKGNPIETKDRVHMLAEELKNAIKRTLRRGDLFSLCSPSQFVLMLNGTNEEDCKLIAGRITKAFCEKHNSWKKCLRYYVTSAIDLDVCGSSMHFSLSEEWMDK